MQDNSANNKRIAKNTMFLYFRMILILVVTLYTSRVVLAELGVVDYGIYNVVGGVVVMFSFINSSMTTSTQRFLTFELGKGDFKKLSATFAASLNVHIFLGGIIVLLAETIGLWFVNEKLVIPSDRMMAANVVYQCSILSFFINITQVPYNASLISHEKMSIYAYLSIFDAAGKLLLAYALALYGSDKLIFYAILVLLLHVLLIMLYRAYCIRHYKECRFLLFWDKALYSSLTSFAGWNLFGSIAWLFRGQGMNIILNLFYGPTLNAAKGISDKVSSTVMGFIRNFNLAMNPQITKSYATGEIANMENLCYRGSKFAFLLLFMITLPVIVNIDYILHLWLVEVPDYTAGFVTLILMDSMIDVLFGSSQFITAMMATGRIRNYQIVVGVIIMLVLPIGYFLLDIGCGPYSIVYAMIGVSIVADITRFLFCKHQIGFSFRKLIISVWIPVLVTALLSFPFPFLVKKYFFENGSLGGLILTSLLSVVVVSVFSWFIAMNRREREIVSQLIAKKLHKKI